MGKLLLRNLMCLNTAGEAGGGSSAGTGGGGTGGAAGGAGGAPDAGGGGAATPPAGGMGTSNPWFSGFTDADTRAFIETKGFKDPESLASAYRNLEKVRGVPADRLVTLPGDDKPESWNPIFDKLGRPAKPELYELAKAEGVPDQFLQWQAKTFHELGLSKKQAQALSTQWNSLAAQSKANDANAQKEARAEQIANLKKEWGVNAGNLGDAVDKMVGALGLEAQQVEKMENAIGFDGFAKLMIAIKTKFGVQLEESSFHGGTTGGNDFGAMTPAAAKDRLNELMSDPEYKKSWSSGDKAKQKEVDRLFAIQYGNPMA